MQQADQPVKCKNLFTRTNSSLTLINLKMTTPEIWPTSRTGIQNWKFSGSSCIRLSMSSSKKRTRKSRRARTKSRKYKSCTSTKWTMQTIKSNNWKSSTKNNSKKLKKTKSSKSTNCRKTFKLWNKPSKTPNWWCWSRNNKKLVNRTLLFGN